MKPEKFWDFLATNYDANEGDLAQRKDLEIIHRYLQPGDLVLEYACGTGTLANYVARWVKEIHGIDISGKMIAAAKRKAAEQRVENAHFRQATIFESGFASQSFEAVMAFNILHLVEEAPAAVRRINQLLKPGGVFISSTPCLGEKRAWFNSLLSPLFMVPSKMGIIPYVKTFKAAELEELLVQGNFRIIETKKFVAGLTDYLIVARKIGGS
jgi:2-polyprenyl-3-methyl-5-hydroxy-6-metoxy-1,4-benzoquinol methylase